MREPAGNRGEEEGKTQAGCAPMSSSKSGKYHVCTMGVLEETGRESRALETKGEIEVASTPGETLLGRPQDDSLCMYGKA